MFSTGARGWGEAFVTVYPDSDKIGAGPGVMFRRSDAIDYWLHEASETPEPAGAVRSPHSCPALNLVTIARAASADESGVRRTRLASCSARGRGGHPVRGPARWRDVLLAL